MLKIDEDLLVIEDALDDLVAAFSNLEVVVNYKAVKRDFLADEELQEAIRVFQDLSENYEQQKVYEAYRPEIRQLKRDVLAAKRQLDLNDKVIALRRAEVEVQEVLAATSQKLAAAISPEIFVDTGLPLAPHKPPHQKGYGNNIKER